MTEIIQTLDSIDRGYSLLYCDLWGCLHDGHRAFPEAVAALERFRARGGGVVLLTKQVALDYAAHNIRVNCICPSEVNTPMHRKFIAESPDPAATKKRLLERIPLNRVAEPEELAAAALFLASADSSYITGVALPVDGGLTAL